MICKHCRRLVDDSGACECLKTMNPEQLYQAFDMADAEGDDITCLQIVDLRDKAKFTIVDSLPNAGREGTGNQ